MHDRFRTKRKLKSFAYDLVFRRWPSGPSESFCQNNGAIVVFDTYAPPAETIGAEFFFVSRFGDSFSSKLVKSNSPSRNGDGSVRQERMPDPNLSRLLWRNKPKRFVAAANVQSPRSCSSFFFCEGLFGSYIHRGAEVTGCSLVVPYARQIFGELNLGWGRHRVAFVVVPGMGLGWMTG